MLVELPVLSTPRIILPTAPSSRRGSVCRRIANNLVEYIQLSRGHSFVLSLVSDHVTWLVILVITAIQWTTTTIACHWMDCGFCVLGPLEKFCSDQGAEFERRFVKELPTVFGYNKTRIAISRPQLTRFLSVFAVPCTSGMFNAHVQ